MSQIDGKQAFRCVRLLVATAPSPLCSRTLVVIKLDAALVLLEVVSSVWQSSSIGD
jgi:hypothetical protein